MYLTYLKALGGLLPVLAIFAIFLGAQVVEIGVTIALRYWASSYDIVEGLIARMTAWTPRATSLAVMTFTRQYGEGDKVTSLGTGNSQTDYWLKVRLSSLEKESRRLLTLSLQIYVGLVGFSLLFYALRSGYLLWRGLAASRTIYVDLIDGILGAPTRFFDTTPSGRIMNRLSKVRWSRRPPFFIIAHLASTLR